MGNSLKEQHEANKAKVTAILKGDGPEPAKTKYGAHRVNPELARIMGAGPEDCKVEKRVMLEGQPFSIGGTGQTNEELSILILKLQEELEDMNRVIAIQKNNVEILLSLQDKTQGGNRLFMSELARKHAAWVRSIGRGNGVRLLEAMAGIAAEVGEAINEVREGRPTSNFKLELADIILRVFTVAESNKIDIEGAVREKMLLNEHEGSKGRTL